MRWPWSKPSNSSRGGLPIGRSHSGKSRTSILNYADPHGGGSKAVAGLSGDGTTTHLNARKLSRNARRAYSDSLEARAIVDRNADIVVDTGIKISPTVNAAILGLSEEEADAWNTDVADRFHLYCKSKTSHRSRMYNVYEAQRLFNKTLLIDNDQFIRFYFQKEDDALSTLSFGFIDPMDIMGTGVLGTDGSVNSRDGIERDYRGRETKYHIRQRQKNGTYKTITVPRTRSGRTIMSHGFIADQINQLRGLSCYGHILQEFQNITDFKLAHIDKAIQQASIAIAVENDGDTDPSDPFEDISTPAGTIPAQLKASAITASEKELAESMEINRVDDFATGGKALNIVNLRAKDKIHSISNTAPVTNYDKFVESFTSHIAASARMPVEVLLMKFGSNYSASRAALLLFYRVAEIYRAKIDTDFMTPLYENWIAEEIAAGRVVARGWTDPVLRAAWTAHSIVGAPVPNIDPTKTANSNKINAALGLVDLDRAAQETNGSSGKANRAALKRQLGELEVPYYEKDNREDNRVVQTEG